MAKRVKLLAKGEAAQPQSNGNGVYFPENNFRFLETGCALLNLVISGQVVGGGWPLGRVINIVGDKSTGKTLLAEEAMANFIRTFPKGEVYYRESEAAFDNDYAQALGLDTSKVDFGPTGVGHHWDTVESVMDDLNAILTRVEKRIADKIKEIKTKNKKASEELIASQIQGLRDNYPVLYIIDSLDALTTENELDTDIREGTYGTAKAKRLSELFRRNVRRCKETGICLIVISQIRDRIGANIRGEKYTRAGGRALNFYASIIIHLAEVAKLTRKRTLNGVEVARVIGLQVKAKCTKNKVTAPFRECEFKLIFGYGIDDEASSLEWLKEMKLLPAVGFEKMPTNLDGVDGKKLRGEINMLWHNVEKHFAPEKGKYT